MKEIEKCFTDVKETDKHNERQNGCFAGVNFFAAFFQA